MTNYMLLSSGSAAVLATMVMKRLQLGWILYGNPFSCGSEYCQALIFLSDSESQ